MKKEQLKYYIGTFVLSLIFMIVMLIIAHSKGQYLFMAQVEGGDAFEKFSSNYWSDIIITAAFPFAFTGIFLLVDVLSRSLRSKKKKEEEKEETAFGDFVNNISALLSSTKKFNVEDFRHFRDNKKFQEVLKRLHMIYNNGETEDNSYFLCLRKFEKGTRERDAVEYLVTFTEKMIKEKSLKEDAKKDVKHE